MSPLQPGRPQPVASEPERPWWGLGDVAIGLVAAQVFSILGVGVLYAVTGWDADRELPIWATAVLQIPLWLGLAGSLLWATHRKGTGLGQDFGFRMLWWDPFVGAVVGIATQLLVLPLIYWPLLGLLDKTSDDLARPAEKLADQAQSPVGWVLLALIVVAGAPVVEELFYRGLTQRALRKRGLPHWAAVLLSALLFALMHFQALQFAGLFVFGIILGAMARYFRRLGPGIWAHAAFNAVTVIALYRAR